jgi:hypothetical protein
MLRTCLLLLLVLPLVPLPVLAQETAESPDLERDERVSLGGLVQTQFNTSSVDDVRQTEMRLRRVRLSADTRLNEFVSGRIQAELANAAVGGSAQLNEAYALFTFAPAFQILAGKGGRPFGIVDATSSSALIPIERGARFRGARTLGQYRVLEELAYAGRSVGAQVLGEAELGGVRLVYAGGYFRGATGEEGTDADIQQFAARVQASPVPWAKIAVAATSRVFAREDPVGSDASPEPFPDAAGADVVGEARRGAGYAVDFELGRDGEPGPTVLGVFAVGTVDPFRDQSFVSLQGWAAYRVGGLDSVTGNNLLAVQPLVRASWSDVEGLLDAFDGLFLTSGVNFYAASRTKLALNLDLFFPEDGSAMLSSFKVQVQIAF